MAKCVHFLGSAPVSGSETLELLSAPPEALIEIPELAQWLEEITNDITTGCVGGLDATVAMMAAESGIDVAAVVANSPKRQRDRRAGKEARERERNGGKKQPKEVTL